MKLLRHFSSHENIISVIDIMTVPPFSSHFKDIYIVTNLMESDLERIITSRQRLSDQHYQYFLYQILRALKYIHTANVLHRDLKPSNLLVNANCDLAICDFGLARGFDAGAKDVLTEYVVTRWYRAPEILCEYASYGKPVDVWGVGCIFAELLTHAPFFQGDSPKHQLEIILTKMGCPPREKLAFLESTSGMQKVVARVSNLPVPSFHSFFPPNCNPLAIDLLSQMLKVHPDDRISVNEALEHPYLKDFHGQMSEPSSRTLFDFDFERGGDELSYEEVMELMYQEVLIYRPEAMNPSITRSLSIGEAKDAEESKRTGRGDKGSDSKYSDHYNAEEEEDDDRMVLASSPPQQDGYDGMTNI